MWFAFRQQVLRWFGSESDRVSPNALPEDFRMSEPVFTDVQTMERVGNGNVQVGQNSNVRVVHRNVTNIYVLSDLERRLSVEPPAPAKSDFKRPATTHAQREVMSMIRELRSPELKMSVYTFMEKQFGTQFELELQDDQLMQVHRYVQSMLTRMKKSRREKT